MNPFEKHRQMKKYIVRLVRELEQDYGIPVELRVKNTRRTYHQKRGNLHRLFFGLVNLEYDFDHGFHEYKSIQWIWKSELNATGMHAIHNVVLHEFAHVLQTERYERKRGSVHNHEFIKCLVELIEKYPYHGTIKVKESKYAQITNARAELQRMFASA